MYKRREIDVCSYKPGFHIYRNYPVTAVSRTGRTLGHAGDSSVFNGNILHDVPGAVKVELSSTFPGLRQLRGSYGYMETRLLLVSLIM